MRRVSQLRKRDYNEPEIVAALKAVGAQIIKISEPGAPDLLVLFRGGLFVLEVKQPRGRLTPEQQQLQDAGWPVFLVRSADDALRAIGCGL